MKRLSLCCLLALAGLTDSVSIANAAQAIAAAKVDAGWTSLFDGKSLDGWHVIARPDDVDKDFWKVEDGLLVCDSRGRKKHNYVWLMSNAEYGDFEFKLKVRSYKDSTGNAGIQVRSRYDHKEQWLDGPQIDLHPPGPYRTGLIYDETRGVKHWIHPVLPGTAMKPEEGVQGWKWKHADDGDGWNEIHVICRGTQITTTVNGVPAANYDGKGVLDDAAHRALNVGLNGHIALQLHTGSDLYIQYKDIVLKKL
ncbi:MAG TPA: DUF1080 domain-containing protein [Opitutaceae bacterium]